MSASLPSLLRAYAADALGAASIELALGGVVLVSVSVLCFDLYARIKAETSIARMAIAMADYVSRDTAPDGNEMTALGEFLYEHELGAPASLVYVVTAIHQPTGETSPVVLWSDDTIRMGDETVTAELAGECAHYVAEGGAAGLPDGFTPMSTDEVVVIVEVCARLTREGSLSGRFVGGDIYRLHALPARETGQIPAEPVYVERWSVIAASHAAERFGACAGTTLLQAACPSSTASLPA